MGADWSVRALLALLGTGVLGAGLQAGIPNRFEDRWALIFSALGLLLLLGSFAWTKLQTVLGADLVASAGKVASDFRVWLAIILFTFLVGASVSVFTSLERNSYAEVVQQDFVPLRIAIEKWVLPRRLSERQISQIGAYLGKFKPYSAELSNEQNDREAYYYRGDIYLALTKGGWVVTKLEEGEKLAPGVAIHVFETAETAQNNGSERDPKAGRLLMRAFALAGIRFDTSQGSSGASITSDLIKIEVGPRMRDSDAPRQLWPDAGYDHP